MSTSPSAISADPRPAATKRLRTACVRAFAASLDAAACRSRPFPHRLLTQFLPPEVIAGLAALPFQAPALDGRSGAREIHNDKRRYFDPELIAREPLCAAVAGAFQSQAVVAEIEAAMEIALGGCHLRIEFAQDTDGFWLAPHTDLGVKRFTLLGYLAPEDRPDLGTDLYADERTWSQRPAFAPGLGLAFAPSDHTWHGFAPRPIGCVRKSLIVNYVTSEWRAREQLAFPDTPVEA